MQALMGISQLRPWGKRKPVSMDEERKSSGFNMSDPTYWDKGHNQMDTFRGEEVKGIKSHNLQYYITSSE